MRIEGGSYPLALRGPRAPAREEPQAVDGVFEARGWQLPPPPRGPAAQEDPVGFAEALMNVTVAPRSIHQTALLFEVQRIAQGEAGVPARADAATDATLAYRDSLDRNALPRRRGFLWSETRTIRI
ncbi:MAG: hypothetical protein TEF_09340 [Rhizobiales bacterium NRL2]|jgi:hypothetical protein|nr:MAG: hypothetical protein TEF_09340 [Rhizobiales bacterium NRL2]